MLVTLMIGVAVALSGAAALAYEICWSRALVVPLGNSSDAAALVLAGFMLGIAAGARLGGGLAERVSSPLRLYAFLELLLGGYALLAPKLLELLSALPAGAGGDLSLALGIVLRYAAALALIVLPGLAMGATLPLLIRALTRPGGVVGPRIGILYGANTIGAALGAFVTGFWGIATIGLWGSSAVAAGASLAAGCLALLASRWLTSPAAANHSAEPRPSDGGTQTRGAPRLVGTGGMQRSKPAARPAAHEQIALLAAFVSGFAMLGCELLWARVLTFVFGHDTYAFASLLGFVLLGLGAGGLCHRLLYRFDQRKLLATLLSLFAVVVLLSFWSAAALVVELGRDPFGLDAAGSLAVSIWLELYRELCYTPILVFLPSLLAGLLFPTACSLYGSAGPDAGRRVGIVGLVNGLGAGLGALASAWFLVTLAGIQAAFVLLALLSAATASIILVVVSPRSRLATAVMAALPIAWLVLIVELMPQGLPRRMLLKTVGERHQLLRHYEEARTSTVSVIENQINGERQLLINAVNEVTTRLVHDQSFKLLGHLGPLLHPEPQTGVMICLGAGLSAGAALSHPLERLDVIDLSSAVARGARHFAAENNGVLDDPRFELHIADGRQFLLNTASRYQVAIIDSTHPKSVDSWILYTKEFYELLRERLSDGGIAVQWLPLHGLSEREFKIVVRTFQSAFPELTLWANVGFETYGQTAYAKLVGVRGGPLRIDVERLERRLAQPQVQQDLARYGITSSSELLDLFIAGPAAIRDWTDGLPVQTDDHPLVPYTTSFSAGRRMEAQLLLALRSPVTPLLSPPGGVEPERSSALAAAYDAQGLVLAGRLERAAELRPEGRKIRLYQAQRDTTLGYYTALAKLYPDDPDKLFEAATQLGNLGHPTAAQPIFRQALALRPRDFRLRLNLALVFLQLAEPAEAIELLAQLRTERPGSALVLRNLGVAVLASGDPGVAVHHLEEALAVDPESLGARLALSQARFELGELDQAEAELTEVVRRNRWVAEAHDRLGLIAARREDYATASTHHARACQLQPYRAVYHYNRAVALQAMDELGQAAQSYRAALALEPNYAAALNILGLIHAAEERFEQAALFHLQALDVDPHYAAAAHNLGLARRHQGKRGAAVQAFCRALRLDSTLAPPRQQLLQLGGDFADCGF
ncbi:MAG: hypothetical protein DRI90_05460 [Deltaproteobacteria bacterium]|nr:MAG: hypothetical protein DRI90_05460 [Deltaproteobacteria bacterium]